MVREPKPWVNNYLREPRRTEALRADAVAVLGWLCRKAHVAPDDPRDPFANGVVQAVLRDRFSPAPTRAAWFIDDAERVRVISNAAVEVDLPPLDDVSDGLLLDLPPDKASARGYSAALGALVLHGLVRYAENPGRLDPVLAAVEVTDKGRAYRTALDVVRALENGGDVG